MGGVLGIVIPLAAGAAISPTVLTLQLVTLSGKVSPVARGWAVAAGYGAILLVLTAVGFALAASTGGSGTPSDTEAWVKLGFAVALALLGIRTLRAPPKPEQTDEPESARPRLARYFGLGAVLMATNVTTTMLFLPAIHDIGASDLDLAGKAAVAALVLAITAIPAVAPPLGVTLLGHRAEALLDALNRFTSRHRRGINAGICFGFATFLAAVSLPVLV